MNEFLILNDGTRLLEAHAILSGSTLWVYLDGELTLAQAFNLLNDPEKTRHITANEYGAVSEYNGFTDLFCIRREDDGQVNAGLNKAVN